MSTKSEVPYSKTIQVRDTCLCLHLQRAARAMARRFDRAFQPFGITNGQFSLLMALNRPEPPPMAPVAALLAMDRTTLTAALKPLIRQEFVEVLPGDTDRRQRRLRLTQKGLRLLTQALPVWDRLHAEIENNILDGHGDRLRKELLALSTND